MRSLTIAALLFAALAASCSVEEKQTVGESFLLEQGLSPKAFGDTTLSEGIIESTFTQRAQTVFPNVVLVEAKWNNAEARIFLRFVIDTGFDNFKTATLVLHENTPIRRFGSFPVLTIVATDSVGTVAEPILVSTDVSVQETDTSGLWSFTLDSAVIERITTPESGQTTAKVLFQIEFPDTAPDFIRRFHASTAEFSLRPALKFIMNDGSRDSVLSDSSGFVAEAPLPLKPTISIFPSDRGVLILNANRLVQSIDSNVVLARAIATFFIDTANVLAEQEDTLSLLEVRVGFKGDTTSIAPPTFSSRIKINDTPEVPIDITRAFREFQTSRRQTGTQIRDLGLFLDAQAPDNMLLLVPLLDSIKIDLLFTR